MQSLFKMLRVIWKYCALELERDVARQIMSVPGAGEDYAAFPDKDGIDV